MQGLYSWNRYWRLLDLPNTDKPASEAILETYESIDRYNVLVLLGAPGLGKTYEARRAFEKLKTQGALTDFVSLRRITRLEDLTTEIHKSSSYTRWQSSTGSSWTLFLDGFDEASIPFALLANWISSTLRGLVSGLANTQTLRVRITSRAPEWTQTLEEDLRELWGPSAVAVYVLQPLTEEDITQVSDAAEFKRKIQQLGLKALAERPVTLRMLARLFARSGSLPDTAVKLYSDGLRATVEEKNPAHSPAYEADSNRLEFQIALLGRIAAVSILSSRPQIWTGLYSGARPDNAVAVSEVSGGQEIISGETYTATERAVREAIRSGPLTIVSPDTFEWGHQTFAEFLAAKYLATHVTPISSLLDILSFNEGGRQSVYPQLREVAVWIAGFDGEFRRRLIDTDPDILILSDMASAGDDDRRELLDSLLARFEGFRLSDMWDDPRVTYERFNHPAISSQLRPYLLDATKNNIVRRFALEVASACNATDLVPDLLTIAQREGDSDHIRARAVRTVGKIGTDSDKAALKEILKGGIAGDLDDEIRGSLLRVLWPAFLTYNELFEVLRPRQRSSFFGSYWRFVHEFRPKFETSEEAVAGLQWLGKQVGQGDSEQQRLASAIVVAALAFIDSKDVQDALASLFIKFAKAHHFLAERTTQAALVDRYRRIPWPVRRELISKILDKAGATDRGIVLWQVPWPLFDFEDLADIVRDFSTWQTSVGVSALVDVILVTIRGKTPDEAPSVWNLADGVPELERALEKSYSISLESAFAKYERERIADKKATEVSDTPDWRDTLDKLVAETTADPNQWWRVDLALLEATPDSAEVSEFMPNLSETPRWHALPQEYQKQLVSCARRYLVDGTLTDTSWLGTQTWYRPAAAAYRALRLLAVSGTAEFENLPKSVWKKWAAAVAGFSSNGSNAELDIQAVLARLCYLEAPEDFLAAVKKIVAENYYPIGFDRVIAAAYDDEVAAVVWDAVSRVLIPESAQVDPTPSRLAMLLIERRYPPAIALAQEQLQLAEANEIEGRKPSPDTVVAASFVLNFPDEAWPILTSTMVGAPMRVKEVLTWIADNTWHRNDTRFLQRLSEEGLADIYEWVGRFGLSQKEHDGTFRLVTASDKLLDIQRASLLQLESRGTAAAIAQLERLSQAFPEENWLQLNLENARKTLQKEAWEPAAPREVLTTLLGDNANEASGLKEAIQAKAAADLPLGAPSRSASELLRIDDSIELPKTETAPPPQSSHGKGQAILAVADEWASRRGGISTFNRDLCVALAAEGCDVRCLVLEATSEEIADAKRLGVQLEIPKPQIGISGHQLLLTWEPAAGFNPDIVIGHDHITGRHARYLARERLNNTFFVHMIHTVPEEIGPYKDLAVGAHSKMAHGYEKGSRQRALCDAADLVVAVGPTIEELVQAYMPLRARSVLCMVPGYDSDLAATEVSSYERLPLQVLFVGRAEDARLKGVDIVLGIASVLNNQLIDGVRTAKFIIRGIDAETSDEEIGDLLQGYGDLNRKSVWFRPYTTDKNELRNDLLASSCVVMPSRTEGFGLVALEALAAGKPILVTSSSGFARHLIETTTLSSPSSNPMKEWILNVDDDASSTVSAWAEAVKNILIDRKVSFEKARVCRDTFRSHFDWQRSARELLNRIAELKGKGSSTST